MTRIRFRLRRGKQKTEDRILEFGIRNAEVGKRAEDRFLEFGTRNAEVGKRA
jgi:hypothetical protein